MNLSTGCNHNIYYLINFFTGVENKHVGWIIIGISVIIIGIVFLFNSALREIVAATCTEHGSSCPMYTTITQQTFLALAIVGVLVIFGAVLIFSKPKETVIVRKVPEKKPKKKYNLSDLRSEDKKVFSIVRESGAAFQADLIEKTGFGKAKMSRIIDRLENRGLVERKRRGMTNVVVLKD